MSDTTIVYILESQNYAIGSGTRDVLGVFASLEGAKSGHPYKDKDHNPLVARWEELASGGYMGELGNVGVTLYIYKTELKP